MDYDAPGELDPDADHQTAAAQHVPSLSWYPNPLGGQRPVVIVCPGGGYNHRADHEGEPVAQRMHALGCHAAVCHYRLHPWLAPTPHLDISRAVRLIRHQADQLQVIRSAVVVLGFSAGGHLAGSILVHNVIGNPMSADPIEHQSSRPDAGVLCYPVISLGNWRHDGSRRKLLGDPRQPEQERFWSIDQNVTAQTPPTFCWHTADDGPVPAENCLRMASALSRHGVPYGLHIFPHGRHGVGLAADDIDISEWPNLLGRWLARIGIVHNIS